NALAGLVNTREEEVAKWDPYQLAGEAVQRMKRNGDVMRADRLKQVMQQIDSSFDEKNLGMSKFTRFVQEAAHRGILASHKMDNGQLEVDLPKAGAATEAPAEGSTAAMPAPAAAAVAAAPAREPRSRRGRGGRGRDREERRPRGEHADSTATADHAVVEAPATPPAPAAPAQSELSFAANAAPSAPSAPKRTPEAVAEPASDPAAPAVSTDGIGAAGTRLTRDEAFDLMRRAVEHIATHGGNTRASDVRKAARELLGRDSESLSERNFTRILKDAHDSDIIDLRRRGDDYEVRPAVVAAPIVDQLGAAAIANAPKPPANAPPAPRGMGPRGVGARGRHPGPKVAAVPIDLLSVGVVDYDTPAVSSAATPAVVAPA